MKYRDSMLMIAQCTARKYLSFQIILADASHAQCFQKIEPFHIKLLAAENYFQQYKKEWTPLEIRQASIELKLSQAYYFRGINQVNRYTDSLNTLVQSIDLLSSAEQKELDGIGPIYTAALINYRRQGDFKNAKKYAFKAYEFGAGLDYIAGVYRMMGKLDSALYFYQIRLDRLEKQQAQSSKRVNRKIISVYRSMADIKLQQNKIAAAKACLKNTLRFGRSDDDQFLSDHKIWQGQIELADKNTDQAIAFFKEALVFKQKRLKLAKSYEYARILGFLGESYHQKGAYKKALTKYQAAIFNYSHQFKSTDPAKNPEVAQVDLKKNILAIYAKKMQAANALAINAPQAKYESIIQNTSETAMELLDVLRKDYSADFDKQFLVAQSYPIYDIAIQQAIRQRQYEAAFQLSEKSKAYVLLAALKKNKSEAILAQMDQDMIYKWGQINIDLRKKQGNLKRSKDANKSATIRAELKVLEIKRNELLKKIRQDHPEFDQMETELTPFSIADIHQKILAHEQSFLEFFLGEDFIYSFYIPVETQQLQVHQIPFSDSLKTMIGAFTTYITEKRMDDKYYTAAFTIFDQVFRPIFQQNIPKRLVIVSDGALSLISLNALLTKAVKPEDRGKYRKYPYWCRQTSFGHEFSVAILANSQMPSTSFRHTKNEILIYAPTFSSFDTTEQSRGKEFRNLKYAAQEANRISKLFQNDLIEKEKATKQHFIHSTSGYRFIHIASHAIVNPSNPDLSYIVFSDIPDAAPNAFKLSIPEIYRLDLSGCDMIILSSCETGTGQIVRGEGTMSLARSTTYAGTKSAITTLWQIDDQSSAQMMPEFYAKLQQGQAKDVALQQMMVDYIDNPAINPAAMHPHFWAAYTVTGNTEPLTFSTPTSFPWLWLIFGLILLGLIGLLAYRFKKN